MNGSLKNRIQTIREFLEADPDRYIIGVLHPGNPKAASFEDIPDVYQHFLLECDGAHCGDIALWSLEQIRSDVDNERGRPSRAELYRMAGGNAEWFCFGGLLYEQLAMRRSDNRVFVFARIPDPPETYQRDLGPIDQFLDGVFSSEYSQICDVQDDEWLGVLRQTGVAN